MSNFFNELKNRNVYKAATAYVVTGWLVMQVVDTMGNNLSWPPEIAAWITKALIVGFPIALVLTWLYEFTPEGLKRTGEVQEDTPDNRRAGKRLNHLIIAGLSLAVIFLLIDRLFISGPVLFEDRELASIGVIPFRYISDQEDKAWMASGLTEDVYHEITRIKGVRAPRIPSTTAYTSGNYDRKELAKLLELNYLLETDIQLIGNDVSLTPKLINTATGMIIWSDRFEGGIEQLQNLKNEIPKKVARQVKINISDIPVSESRDPEAYQLYLKAQDSARYNNVKRIEKSIEYLKEAVALDPEFAEAYAKLALQYRQLAHSGNISNADMARLMKENLDRAMSINPELPDVYVALGRYQARVERNLEGARDSYLRALELQPGNAEAHSYVAGLYNYFGDKGKWVYHMEKAYDLDKVHVNGIAEYTHFIKRDYKEALRRLDIASSLDPKMNEGFQRKSMLLSCEPYGDIFSAFKTAYDQYRKDPYERIHLTTLIPLLLDLDLSPFSDHLVKRMLQLYPENWHTFFAAFNQNNFANRYQDNIDMTHIWEQRRILPGDPALIYAEILLLKQDAQSSQDTLEKAFPEKTVTNQVMELVQNGRYLEIRQMRLMELYVRSLLGTGNFEKAMQMGQVVCTSSQNEILNNPFLRFDFQYEWEESCLLANNELSGLVAYLEELYFEKRHKMGLFAKIKSGYYSLLEPYPEYQDLKRRIIEDTHAMRARAIAYIKEHEEWDPAWEKELGLEE